MRDARFGSDLLLSLRFNGAGPDCILRRRVKELGLKRRTRGHRAGLHCVHSRRAYVLTSSALGSVPVITGNLTLILLRYRLLQPLLLASRSGLIIVPQIA